MKQLHHRSIRLQLLQLVHELYVLLCLVFLLFNLFSLAHQRLFLPEDDRVLLLRLFHFQLRVVIRLLQLVASAQLFEQLRQIFRRFLRDGFDVALKNQKVSRFDEDTKLFQLLRVLFKRHRLVVDFIVRGARVGYRARKPYLVLLSFFFSSLLPLLLLRVFFISVSSFALVFFFLFFVVGIQNVHQTHARVSLLLRILHVVRVHQISQRRPSQLRGLHA
mmetsp:Transcript_3531/g.12597  ORF Transcript_3531/g.12597 Transcript_3531/m.12597 type:complete len:219 (-) Transcript_3531:331-987(-)